jgi:hypothetical protein
MSTNLIHLAEERARRRRPAEASPTNLARLWGNLPPAPPPNLEWKLSQRGNPYIVVNEAFHVVLFRRAGAWAFRIEDLRTEQAWFSEHRYSTEDVARADALLAVNQLRGKEPERLG